MQVEGHHELNIALGGPSNITWQVLSPLVHYIWGDLFGWCLDKLVDCFEVVPQLLILMVIRNYFERVIPINKTRTGFNLHRLSRNSCIKLRPCVI